MPLIEKVSSEMPIIIAAPVSSVTVRTTLPMHVTVAADLGTRISSSNRAPGFGLNVE